MLTEDIGGPRRKMSRQEMQRRRSSRKLFNRLMSSKKLSNTLLSYAKPFNNSSTGKQQQVNIRSERPPTNCSVSNNNTPTRTRTVSRHESRVKINQINTPAADFSLKSSLDVTENVQANSSGFKNQKTHISFVQKRESLQEISEEKVHTREQFQAVDLSA